ncbi:UNVERIFIED_CONTAM: hypothetical protein H355_009898, partial [Colinus virginianus]
CLHTSTVIGPFLGFLLASFCAKLFVDLEYVDAGVYNIPIICLGYFFGGLFMKKFKINTYQAAHIAFWVTFLDYLLYFIAFWTICDTSPVAGLTVTYEGIDQLSYSENTLLADCNRDCDCALKVWDPVCANSGITYVSSCLAGCKASTGTGISVVKHQFYSAVAMKHTGIPSPIFFGALIDTTCLKWGTKSCGGEGACRLYDIAKYRWIYLGLPALLRGVSFIPGLITIFILKKKFASERNVSLNAPVELQDKGQ